MTNLDLHLQTASSTAKVIAINYAGFSKFGNKAVLIGHAEEGISIHSKQENYEGWLQLGLSSRTSKHQEAPIKQPMSHSAFRPTMERTCSSSELPAPQGTLPLLVDHAPVLDPLLAYWSDSSSCSPAKKIIPNPIISNVPQSGAMCGYNLWQYGYPSGITGEEMWVVKPSPRPHIGVWLELQAAQNQLNESLILPQILKSYMRIKDGNMTVRLVMKYLANKLGLEDESVVEVTCRSLKLLPNLTLQQVRDYIWFSREASMFHFSGPLFLRDSPDTRPVLVLRYSRRAWYTDPVVACGAEIG